MYVRLGTKLSGTVTDNVAVDRVILREAGSTIEFARATITGDRWEILLEFGEERNGDKITIEIVAYDTAGNSGDSSIKAITLIIDIRPPIIEDMWIQRSPSKTAYLEPLDDLLGLETSDPRGERSANVNRYQNGWFNIYGKVAEEETRIDSIKLNIYDYDVSEDAFTLLLELDKLEDSSSFTPCWLIKEEDIIDAGNAIWPDYKTKYYNAGERYYYRVEIVAYDRSSNVSNNEDNMIHEDEGFFCMWEKADEPKGILDPIVGTVVTKGSTLPVEFFDDDALDWAYTGLLTLEQWNGEEEVAPGVTIEGATNKEKIEWLKNRLTSPLPGNIVYDWKYDKYGDEIKIMDQVGGKSIDEKVFYVQTGNNESDFGDYVLFTLVQDKKLEPHTGAGPWDTNKPRWIGRYWEINVIDENMPLIIFDTVDTTDPGYDLANHSGGAVKEPIAEARTGNSPEENTFPKLTTGQIFEINGYTLRANKEGQGVQNEVVEFRMAWIPFGMAGEVEANVKLVQETLAAENYPDGFAASSLSGVQHWDFVQSPGAGQGEFIEGTPEDIGDSKFKKQVFRKKFDILGEADDLKPSYNNFTFNGSLENETKLFVIYAKDNVGHIVYRQLRLLPNKTPPDLAVYDISGRIGQDEMPFNDNGERGPPNVYDFDPTGEVGDDYDAALKTYNESSGVYNTLKGVSLSGSTLVLTEADRTIPFQTYTRNTILKYWVMAERSGDLAIKDINMKDITFSENVKDVGGGYNSTNRALGFCEYYPDVTQRVFLFEATDTLDNVARIQRTIAVTSTAMLESITTTSQNGSYGIGNEIILRANFSGQIYIQPGTGGERPRLNIRYPLAAGGFAYQAVQCEPVSGSSLYLEFKFTIPEGALGKLETMYDGAVFASAAEVYKRPITLNNGARVIDFVRDEPAFVPSYVIGTASMPNWTTSKGSLQYGTTDGSNGKNIQLDGVRPVITSISLSGKDPYAAGEYYFKTDETINLTLSSGTGKDIRPSDVVPCLQYYINADPMGTPARSGPYFSQTAFAYQRPSGSKALVFSLAVDAANLPVDGELVDVSLYSGTGSGNIVDEVGNAVVVSSLNNLIPAGNRIFIKKTAPAAPVAQLSGVAIPTGTQYYNTSPSLTINNSTGTLSAWEDVKQYSLNGGLIWNDYASAVTITNGTHNLQARYVDRAGNEGAVRSQSIEVNADFPKLIAVSAAEPNGWYTGRTGNNNLTFNLAFDDQVLVQNSTNVTITLTNRNTLNSNNGAGTNPTYEIELQASAGQATLRTSIKFEWTGITGKEMPDGLYVSAVNLAGLRDRYGNSGGTGTATFSAGAASVLSLNGCPNLGAGLLVDAIAPRVSSMVPVSDGVLSGTRRTITITFNEPMMKGSGTITIRPRAGFLIPPVFENDGYYFGTDGNRYKTPQNGPTVWTTYVDGFYDIYNNVALDAADKQKLTQSANATNPSMGNLATNVRTGQSIGPYQRLTNGLKLGNGYTGNYDGTGFNGPNPQAGFLIPDTATKWVLDYKLRINDTTDTKISDIRDVLTKTKFRWQEIDVINTSVSGNTVTITLNEPLLEGLQWDLFYPEGAFTDMAGNLASEVADTAPHYFWTEGVQTPVIRVNRRSYDARAVGSPILNDLSLQTSRGSYPTPPGTTTNWNTADIVVTDFNGWGMTDFNTVHYRIETETPDATLTSGILGDTTTSRRTNKGSVTVAFGTGNVFDVNPQNQVTDSIWTNTGNTNGEWILTNLIRRRNSSYTILENGNTVTRNAAGTYNGFRSYNSDVTIADIDGVMLSSFSSIINQGMVSFDELEAGKSYVVAQAARGGYTSARGYDGVFRTVIALYNNGTVANVGATRPVMVEGSNIKNGMPSIAGFPVRDAEETGDNRYIKMFYRRTTDNAELIWVSTEIVSEWYFIKYGGRQNASTHMSSGEVNNYLTVGYGDLSYGFNLSSSND